MTQARAHTRARHNGVYAKTKKAGNNSYLNRCNSTTLPLSARIASIPVYLHARALKYGDVRIFCNPRYISRARRSSAFCNISFCVSFAPISKFLNTTLISVSGAGRSFTAILHSRDNSKGLAFDQSGEPDEMLGRRLQTVLIRKREKRERACLATVDVTRWAIR